MDRGVGITPIHILSFLLHETMRCSFKMVKNTYKKGEFFRPVLSSEAKKRKNTKPGGYYAKQITHTDRQPPSPRSR